MDPEQLPKDALNAIERGRLIEAIKLVRASKGMDLKQAKDFVEAYVAGRQISLPEAAEEPSHEPASMPQEAVDAIESGKLIEAIKIVRASTGMGLKDAKDFVDAYAAGRQVTPSVGIPAAGTDLNRVDDSSKNRWLLLLLVLLIAGAWLFYSRLGR